MDKLSYEELKKKYSEVCESNIALAKENRELINIKMEKLIVIKKYNKLAEDFEKFKDSHKKFVKEIENENEKLKSGKDFEDVLESVFIIYRDSVISSIKEKEFDISFKDKDQLMRWIDKVVESTKKDIILYSDKYRSNSKE